VSRPKAFRTATGQRAGSHQAVGNEVSGTSDRAPPTGNAVSGTSWAGTSWAGNEVSVTRCLAPATGTSGAGNEVSGTIDRVTRCR